MYTFGFIIIDIYIYTLRLYYTCAQLMLATYRADRRMPLLKNVRSLQILC